MSPTCSDWERDLKQQSRLQTLISLGIYDYLFGTAPSSEDVPQAWSMLAPSGKLQLEPYCILPRQLLNNQILSEELHNLGEIMQDKGRNLKAFAGSQLTRLASSNAVNRAYELGVRVKDAAVQASQPSTPGEGGQSQSWKEWAIQKIPTRGPSNPGVETVYLFPGWATRRSTNRDGQHRASFCALSILTILAGFTLHVQISGFASSLRPPGES